MQVRGYVEEVASTDQIFGPVCVGIERIRVASSSSGTLSIPGLRSRGTEYLPASRLTWCGSFAQGSDRRPRPGEQVSRSHRMLSQSLNLTGIRLDILRVTETPGMTFKDKIRFKFPFVSIVGVA